MGSLSFRLGHDNKAYGNYFYGTGASDSVTDDNYQTGGIRIYGADHSVYDNYMEGLSGTSWRLPLLIDNGDTSDSSNGDSHQNPTGNAIYNNTIVNSTGGGIYVGREDSIYKNAPTNNTIKDNVVIGSQGTLFGNDADDMRAPGRHIDPRVMIGDLSSNPAAYGADRMALINKLF